VHRVTVKSAWIAIYSIDLHNSASGSRVKVPANPQRTPPL